MARKRKQKETPKLLLDNVELYKSKRLCAEQRTSQIEKRIQEINSLIKNARGPEMILTVKIWNKELDTLKNELIEIKKDCSNMYDQINAIKLLDKKIEEYNNTNETVTGMNRLLPVKHLNGYMPPSVSLRELQSAKRAQEKRMELLYPTASATSRQLNQDKCTMCGDVRHVDKEVATSVCLTCGTAYTFATHIFEMKDFDKDEDETIRQHNLSYMQRYIEQFKRGVPQTSRPILESLATSYMNIHVMDSAKVQNSQTLNYAKKLKLGLTDRITKELKGEPIPEFSQDEIATIINQRVALQPRDPITEEIVDKKSFRNDMYIRHLGRANKIEQSRLIPYAKTANTQNTRIRDIETLCELQKSRFGDQPHQIWSMFPST